MTRLLAFDWFNSLGRTIFPASAKWSLLAALCLLPSLAWGQGYHSIIAAADLHARLQDNAASTTVVNDNGDDGTLIGAGNTSASTTTGPTTWLPAAISLDGTDDYIDFDKPTGWTSYPVSFGVWCKINAVSGNQVAASFHANGATGQYLAIYANDSTNSNRPSIVARNTTDIRNASASGATTNWTFLSATYHSATDRRLYVNGVHVATGTSSVTIPSSNKLAFGRLRTSGTVMSVAGAIAGAVGNDVAWSDGDHAQLYAGPEPTLTAEATIALDGVTVLPTYNNYSNGSLEIHYQWQVYDGGDWVNVDGQTNPHVGPEDWEAEPGVYRLSYYGSNDGGDGDAGYSNEVEIEGSSVASKLRKMQHHTAAHRRAS